MFGDGPELGHGQVRDRAGPSGSGPCESPGPTLPIRTPNDAFRSRHIILFQYNRNEISFYFTHTRKTFLSYKEDRGESIPRGGVNRCSANLKQIIRNLKLNC